MRRIPTRVATTGRRLIFSEQEWTSPLPGVRHKVQSVGTKILRLVEYSSAMEPHWCERAHAGYILEGRFEIEFADETLVLEAGDGVHITSGISAIAPARLQLWCGRCFLKMPKVASDALVSCLTWREVGHLLSKSN
jgi:hypothetical protein